MTPESLTIVVFVLCVIVAMLTILLLALARQIGILHTRLAPAGALTTSEGPAIGEAAPRLSLHDISNRPVKIGGSGPQPTLLLFVSPSCPICRELVPVARSLARDEKLALLFASDGGEVADHVSYIERLQLKDFPYLLSSELGMSFAASKLPFAVLIDADGVLRGRGLVNSREHLESLVESMLSGYQSLQDYLVAESGSAQDLGTDILSKQQLERAS